MIQIKITQEFYSGQQVQDALEIIATQIKHGSIHGRSPDWHLISDEE